jgi:ANTAR domain
VDVRSERTGLTGCVDPVVLSAPAVEVPATPQVALVRTPRGWSVICPAGAEPVDGLVEAMTLADVITDELGQQLEPDRSARRSARGPATTEAEDPRDARIAALERTVAQLEHALAARVSTERAIGVLAERHATSPRAAFEALRAQARSLGRPVQELAREVLAALDRAAPAPPAAGEPAGALPPAPRRPSARRVERGTSRPGSSVPADGRR